MTEEELQDRFRLLLVLGIAGLLFPLASSTTVTVQGGGAGPPGPPGPAGGIFGHYQWENHFNASASNSYFPFSPYSFNGADFTWTILGAPNASATGPVARAAYTSVYVSMTLNGPLPGVDTIDVIVWRRPVGGAWGVVGTVIVQTNAGPTTGSGDAQQARGTIALVGAAGDMLTLEQAIHVGMPLTASQTLTMELL